MVQYRVMVGPFSRLRLCYRFVLVLLLFFVSVFSTSAHPLDISLSVLEVGNEAVKGTIYIHPYEFNLLAEENGINLQQGGLGSAKQEMARYLRERFIVRTGEGPLRPIAVEAEDSELYQILSDGLYLNFRLNIDRSDYPVTFDVSLFTEYFSTQTNKLILLNENGEMFPGGEEVFLTVRRQQWTFDLNNPDFSSEKDDLTDTDEDGLTDHQEKIYGFDPENPDTDGDGYDDFIEMSFGWDPFDPAPSPGQSWEKVDEGRFGQVPAEQTQTPSLQKQDQASEPTKPPVDRPEKNQKTEEKQSDTVQSEAAEKEILQSGAEIVLEPKTATGSNSGVAGGGEDISEKEPQNSTDNLIKRHDIRDKNIPDSRFLNRTLSKLQNVATGGASLFSIISLAVSIFALGFIHASMPGHGKGILFSYLTQVERKFRHALGFITTFTITHLADVIILSLGLTFLSSSYSSAKISTVLKYVGGAGLLLLAVFMIIKGITDIRSLRKQGKEANLRNYEGNMQSTEAAGAVCESRFVRSARLTAEKKSTKSAVLLGLLTGLAPCPFGWAIILLLMSLGKLALVPPVIIVFAFGIFVFLLLVAIAFFLARGVASKLFTAYGRYSRLVSGVLLLIFAVFFFISKVPTL